MQSYTFLQKTEMFREDWSISGMVLDSPFSPLAFLDLAHHEAASPWWHRSWSKVRLLTRTLKWS